MSLINATLNRMTLKLLKDEKEVPNEVLCRRLDQLSDAVTEGRESVLREFLMRIPAELDHDADIVLAEASRRLREFSSHNAPREPAE